jgi:hypothetical protein
VDEEREPATEQVHGHGLAHQAESDEANGVSHGNSFRLTSLRQGYGGPP